MTFENKEYASRALEHREVIVESSIIEIEKAMKRPPANRGGDGGNRGGDRGDRGGYGGGDRGYGGGDRGFGGGDSN